MKLQFWTPTRGVITRDVKLQRVIKRYCMLLNRVKNADFQARPGQLFIIDGLEHTKGFSLELPQRCACCGLTGRVTRVPWRDVLIAGDPPVEPTKDAVEAAERLHEGAGKQLLRWWDDLGRDGWWWRKKIDPITGELLGVADDW